MKHVRAPSAIIFQESKFLAHNCTCMHESFVGFNFFVAKLMTFSTPWYYTVCSSGTCVCVCVHVMDDSRSSLLGGNDTQDLLTLLLPLKEQLLVLQSECLKLCV